MNRITTIVFAAVAAALPAFAEVIDYNDTKMFNGNVRAAEDGFQIVKRSWVLGNRNLVKFDPAATYKISVDVRIAPEYADKQAIRFGLHPMHKGSVLGAANVFYIAGSDTELAAPVKVGDTVVKVKNAGKWKNTNGTYIAYDCDPSGRLRDLPNNNLLGPVKAVDAANNTLILAKPAKIALDADVAVRQHQTSWSFLGNTPIKATPQWQTFTFTTKPGVADVLRGNNARYQMWAKGDALCPVIATMTPVEFRNLKIEIIK
jgi:hypothetical protein